MGSRGEDTLIAGWKDINDFTILGSNIFAATNLGVFCSTDHGFSWKAVNYGLPFDSYNKAPQVIRIIVQGTDIFAGTTGEGLFRSTNNGEKWEEADGGEVFNIYGLSAIGSNLFAGMPGEGIFVTTDKGQSWNSVDSGLIDQQDLEINCLTTDGNYLFAGTDNGLFISSDKGISWNHVSIGSLPTQTYAVITLAIINQHLYVGSHYSWRYPISEILRLIQSKKLKN